MALLNNYLLTQLKLAQELNSDALEIATNFAIGNLLGRNKSNNLGELIEIVPEVADQIEDSLRRLIIILGQNLVSEKDYKSIIDKTEFSPRQREIIYNVYKQNQEDLRGFLQNLSFDAMYRYNSLDWRLDLQVASLQNNDELKPKIYLDFNFINENGATKNLLLESDFTNLKNLSEELKEALKARDQPQIMKVKRLMH